MIRQLENFQKYLKPHKKYNEFCTGIMDDILNVLLFRAFDRELLSSSGSNIDI